MADTVLYFDASRQMLADIAEDPAIDGCKMAVVVVVSKNGDIISGIAADEQDPRPFELVGGLELVKHRVMWQFMERIDG